LGDRQAIAAQLKPAKNVKNRGIPNEEVSDPGGSRSRHDERPGSRGRPGRQDGDQGNAPVVVSPWDIAFGAAIASDYNFRGISQSDRSFSPSAYFEPRYNVSKNLQFYAGIGGLGVDLASNPSAEIDLYGGVRPTFGALALDLGFIYYWYPSEKGHSADPS